MQLPLHSKIIGHWYKRENMLFLSNVFILFLSPSCFVKRHLCGSTMKTVNNQKLSFQEIAEGFQLDNISVTFMHAWE
jgi:hypothetical protein